MFVELNIKKIYEKKKDKIKHRSVKPFTKSHRLFSFNNNNLNVYFTNNLTLNIVDMFYCLYLNMSAHF